VGFIKYLYLNESHSPRQLQKHICIHTHKCKLTLLKGNKLSVEILYDSWITVDADPAYPPLGAVPGSHWFPVW